MVVDFRMKRVTLRTLSGDEVVFIGERSNHLSNVIFAATARTMVRKGCEADSCHSRGAGINKIYT